MNKTDLKHKRIFNIRVIYPPSIDITIKPIEGYRVILPGFEGYEFFLHKNHVLDDGRWRLSEATTGFAFPDNINDVSRQNTIANASAILKKVGIASFKQKVARAKRLIRNPALLEDYLEKVNASKQ